MWVLECLFVFFGFVCFFKTSSIPELKRNPSPEKEVNKHKVVIGERGRGGDTCGLGSSFCLWTKESSLFY